MDEAILTEDVAPMPKLLPRSDGGQVEYIANDWPRCRTWGKYASPRLRSTAHRERESDKYCQGEDKQEGIHGTGVPTCRYQREIEV